jgi:hypothetical protein
MPLHRLGLVLLLLELLLCTTLCCYCCCLRTPEQTALRCCAGPSWRAFAPTIAF